jgi:ERCC4-related helicase
MNKAKRILKLKIPLNKAFFDEDEQEDMADDFTLGKKRPIGLAEIDRAGNLANFKTDLKKDVDALDLLNQNLLKFKADLATETIKQRNYKSKDEKLQSLIEKINEKRRTGKNGNNQKVLIFTVYKDTAFYLFDQLKKRGYEHLAVISGDVSKTDSSELETKLFEPILERFAPFTKLFNEREWSFIPSSPDLTKEKQYAEWLEWLSETDKKTFEQIHKPIDILISTDVLSEGQNLQDCDMVINYDIHWNPVRVIQRMGRIDRLGSPNKFRP